jgi:hypothetical protein
MVRKKMHPIDASYRIFLNIFAPFLCRVLQTMPLAPPPPTHPPKSPPLHQSAPVGKDHDNKTDFEQFEHNSYLT